MKITIFGAYGFIGHELMKQFIKNNDIKQIRVPFYGTDVHIKLGSGPDELPNTNNKLQFLSYDPFSDTCQESITKAIEGSDLVINLIGILNEYRPYCLQNLVRRIIGPPLIAKPRRVIKTFDFTHRHMPEQLANACLATATHLLHISAQGVNSNSSAAYLVSKARGEDAIRGKSKLNWTIIRPGLVIGDNANFVKRIRRLTKLSPIMPLPLADSKTQPVTVEDLLFLINQIINKPATYNRQVLNAVGPQELSLADTIKLIANPWLLIPISSFLTLPIVWPMAVVSEILMTNPLITRDNIRATTSYIKVEHNHLAQIKMQIKRENLSPIA